MNRVILIGRLTRDPELRYSSSGTAICNFTLAVDREYNKEETDFIRCVAWRKMGETVANYVQKGRQVAVEGRLQVRKYEDQNGQKKTMTEVVCDKVHFISPRQKQDDSFDASNDTYDDPFGNSFSDDDFPL